MELKELEKKHAEACAKFDKYAKTVEKHKAKVQKLSAYANSEDYWKRTSYEDAEETLRRAETNLICLKCKCEDWQEKINKERERIRQYAECIPSVMHEFCDKIIEVWDGYDKAARDKAKAALVEYYEIDRAKCALINKRETQGEEYKALERQLETLKYNNGGYSAVRGYMSAWVFHDKIRAVALRTDDDIHAKNVKDAEELVRELYFRVAAITGTVESWADLHIALDGHWLDGIVTGKEGTCKVQTIGAGGYNIQRYHFRCLTHKVA